MEKNDVENSDHPVANDIKDVASNVTETPEEKAPEKPQCAQSKRKKGKKKWKKMDVNLTFNEESNAQSNFPQADNYSQQRRPQSNSGYRNEQRQYQQQGYGQRNQTYNDYNQHSYNQQRQASQPNAPGQRSSLGKYEKDDISRSLAAILRHGRFNIRLDKNGYASIQEILSNRSFIQKFGRVEASDIEAIVYENVKKRFEINEVEGDLKIRATQGHSLKVDVELKAITDPNQYDNVIHGTYRENWKFIKKEGLRRLKRQHIHFSPGLLGETQVVSGMRVTSDVIIYLDMEKALNDGIKLFISSNNVILTEGDAHGVLLPKYFRKVTLYNHNTGEWEDINFQAR